MTQFRQRTVSIREKRVGSIAAYSGTLAALQREAQDGPLPQRVRTFSQDAPSDLQHAYDVIGSLDGVAIVVHGPTGCASWLRGRAENWLVTGVTERDSILGGDTKLRATILQAHATYAPRAIFVFATPVVSINNDDIESVALELRDELGLPIVPVYTDGFRSKIGSTGHDVAVYALIKHLMPVRPRPRHDGINLLTLAESPGDTAHLRQLIEALGLTVRYFPRFSDIDQLEEVLEARLSVAVDPGSADFAGTLFEQSFGIPYLAPGVPLGLAATARWIEAIGEATGRREQAAALVAQHEGALKARIQALGDSLKDQSVYINLPFSHALAFAELARDLGLRIAGIKLPHLSSDEVQQIQPWLAEQPDLSLLVGTGQVYEEVNVLRSLRPSLYVGQGSAAVHATRLGIPVLDLAQIPTLGWAGIEAIVERIARRRANTSFQAFLAEDNRDTYAAGWLTKRPHWYIKHEVK